MWFPPHLFFPYYLLIFNFFKYIYIWKIPTNANIQGKYSHILNTNKGDADFQGHMS